MKRGFFTLSVLVTAGALLAAGCTPRSPGEPQAGDAITPQYERYIGPLRHGTSYSGTFTRNTRTEQGGDYDPAISPDGKRLIFASTYHSEIPDIYIKTIEGATITRLTNTSWAEIQPCFSPDGKHFAYATNRRGNWDICVEPVRGSSGPRWVTHSMKSDEISPSWHPGGEWIAFSTYNQRTGKWEIAVKSLKTGQVRYLGEGRFPKFSPDGKKIAFQRARSRKPRWYSVWTVEVDEDFNTKDPTEVVSSSKWAAINPNWSPQGKYIVFATVHESPLAQGSQRILMGDDIWIVNLEGQDLVKLTDTSEPESHPVWARDSKGKHRVYFCSRMRGPRNIWSVVPRLPEPYGSVKGPLPGPREKNPPPAAPGEKADPDAPGALHTYMAPPPPAVSAGGSSDE